MTVSKQLISTCVPVFNEEANVALLYQALLPVFDDVSDKYDFEILFTDNHSTDRTFEELQKLAEKDGRVRVIRFARNFGFQRSIHTAYRRARGAAAVQIDSDLQDPPTLILQFLRKWQEGYHVVYGVRTKRKESWRISVTRKLFHRVINLLSEDDLPLDAGDFRLVDRKALDELMKMDDQQPYLRGAIAALGFEQIGIPYERRERQLGESKFSFGDLVTLATDGILNHSIIPLRIATYVGMVVSALTFLGTFAYLIGRLLFGKDWPPGFATLIILVLGSLSLNAMFLGIIGEYVGRIFRQVKRRPITIIEKEVPEPTGRETTACICDHPPIPSLQRVR